MSRSFCLMGPGAGCGKTWVLLGLVRWLQQQGRTAGAFKPLDVGSLQAQAAERPTDGERFQALELPEHISLLNPFLFNESFPVALAAQRDGIRLDLKLVRQRWMLLSKRYERLLVEGPRTLRTPLTESESWLTLLGEQQPLVLWVMPFGELELELSLLQIEALQQAGLSVRVLLNNRDSLRDGWQLQHYWLTLEGALGQEVQGLLPHLPSGSEDPEAIAQALEAHLPADLKEELLA